MVHKSTHPKTVNIYFTFRECC